VAAECKGDIYSKICVSFNKYKMVFRLKYPDVNAGKPRPEAECFISDSSVFLNSQVLTSGYVRLKTDLYLFYKVKKVDKIERGENHVI